MDSGTKIDGMTLVGSVILTVAAIIASWPAIVFVLYTTLITTLERLLWGAYFLCLQLYCGVQRVGVGQRFAKLTRSKLSWPACYCELLHVVAKKLSIELFVCSSFGLVIRLKLTRLAARFAYPQFLLSSPQTAVTDQFFVTPSALHVITFDMGYPHQTILQPITRLRLFLSYMCEGHSGTKTSLSC